MDTIFSDQMRPVFTGEPYDVHRRLKAGHPGDWTKVFIGEEQKIVTITEYLYREKYTIALEVMREILEKKDLPMYRRNPERFEVYLERTARKLIERILGEEK